MKGLVSKLKEKLKKTREILSFRLDEFFKKSTVISEETLEELEEILITSDIGVWTTEKLIESIRRKKKDGYFKDFEDVKRFLKDEIKSILISSSGKIEIFDKPFVILFLGVNGVGKTTTIAKLALRYKNEGKKVILAASDTFRAAAIEQLEGWGKRLDIEVIKHKMGGDPSAVAYDAVKAAISRNIDVVLVDTAGRLHTKANLMEEMKKIKRVINKAKENAPHEVLLVLDATVGQNAISQVKEFHENIGLTGIVIAKLDGSAKGGVIISIADQFKIPIKLVGIGQSLEDLKDFDAEAFVEAIFE